MRVIDIENITEAMRDDTRFVLRCEEVFHDKISAAAASILMNKSKKPLVCLTGPSGSGKTTTAMRLRDYLENLGVKVCLLSMDNFFLPLDQRPPEATDWESPYCVNVDLWSAASAACWMASRWIFPGTISRLALPAAISPCRAIRTALSLPRGSICSTP